MEIIENIGKETFYLLATAVVFIITMGAIIIYLYVKSQKKDNENN